MVRRNFDRLQRLCHLTWKSVRDERHYDRCLANRIYIEFTVSDLKAGVKLLTIAKEEHANLLLATFIFVISHVALALVQEALLSVAILRLHSS